MLEKLKSIARSIGIELKYYKRLLGHKDTPFLAKCLFWMALAYLALPFDLIPDFIPILGHLDDVIIIPLLIVAAMKLTPQVVKDECRASVDG